MVKFFFARNMEGNNIKGRENTEKTCPIAYEDYLPTLDKFHYLWSFRQG